MKKTFSFFILTLLLITVSACGRSGASEEDVLTVWVPFDLDGETIEEFEKEYDTTVETTVMNASDLQVQLTQVLKTQQNVPDIVYLYDTITKRWVESEAAFLNLSNEFPDDMSYYEENYPEHVVDLGKDEDGDIKTVGYQNPIGVAYYNREIAESLIGTDDAEDVAEAASSIEEIFKLNEELRSIDPSKKLIGNLEDFQKMYLLKREQPWVQDEQLVISESANELFDISKRMYEEDVFAAENPNESAYASGFAENSFLLDYNPTWKLNDIISSTEDTEGEGDWGISTPFIPYHNGGTWMGVTKDSSNKELAWEFVKFNALNEEQLYNTALDNGDVPANEESMEEIVKEENELEALGGQDPFEAFAAADEERSGDIITQYDREITNYFIGAVRQYASGQSNKEEALNSFRNNVRSAHPEIEVD